ncbi:Uncharacterised protein [Nocardia farcinica]|uniref:DUF5642 domain-containing protein n=2 Tax=Nocardia farcinica TaxID=37329 RepID=A0A449GPB9_NOCFR|nr:Uncharacterised protein [Nocardia farcinica]VFA94465.1 Uncharacterised protein [Nocardia farcinica]
MLARMITLRYPGTRLLAGLAAGALLLAGCGGNDETTPSSAPPSTPRDQLLLSIDEFPEGAEKVDLPQDRLQDAVADMTGMQQNSTVTPAECGQTQQDLSTATSELLADSAVIAANDNKAGLMYMEFVAGRAGEPARVREVNAQCPEVTVTSTVEGKEITTVGRVENLAVPAGVNANDAVAFKAVSTSTVGSGKPLTTTAYQGMAVVRGTTVVVRVGALQDSVDQAVFDQLFRDAVRKVEKAA